MGEPSVTGRVIVVAGGTGVVGGAVAEHLLDSGARVVVPSRDPEARVPAGARAVHVPDWEDPSGLVAVLREPGWAPDAVVAALGGWWKGEELVDLDPATWRSLLESHLTSHFLVARAMLPVLDGPDPVYVMLNGAAAEQPMVGSGPVNVTGAGQAMLLDVLRAESIGRRVRLHEVRVLHAVAGDERNEDPQSTAAPQEVARLVGAVLADPGAAPRVCR
ncbi:NAD-dependent epimerase/dehydratase family protein [Actinotalea sp.]|uniref:NAD-dependent epimerase/dehydratase family protein n=1 Tax=Actinotalea sp. TaxID=1872145 RepID=UPI003569DBE9